MKKYLSWIKIRALGELQILTKASYFLLFFIPVLSAVWPSINSTIINYNHSVNRIIETVDSSTKKLEFTFSKNFQESQFIKDKKIKDEAKYIINNLKKKVEFLLKNTPDANSKIHPLPLTWVLLFFSSLFIFIAHLIYQSSSPDLIKKKDIDDYSNNEIDQYIKAPSKLELGLAQKYIKDNGLYELPIKPVVPTKKSKENNAKNGAWELETIRLGAYSNYTALSHKKPVAITFSAFLYLSGIVIIIAVIAIQSYKVAKVAGWV